MSDKVKSIIDVQTIESDSQTDDRWSDFRQIERITIELSQRYKYSLGRYSRFFIELENHKFYATKCSKCNKVYAPPRPFSPDSMDITEWTELSGEGTVKTFSVLHFAPGTNDDVNALQTPYILAYVHLDGADTLFPHLLKASANDVHIGMRVKVAYADEPVSHPIHLMYFIPMEVS